MKQPQINTSRLLLRPFKQAHAKQVQILAGKFNVAKTTLNIPHPYRDGVAEAWIKTYTRNWTQQSQLRFAIINNETGELIGAISLVNLKDPEATPGYWIAQHWWGKGYGTEATNAVIRFAFLRLGIKTIKAEHSSSNPASGKVMQKAGMHYVNTVKRPDRYNNPVDVETYQIQNLA